jgi:hypothetical protein
MILNCPSTIAYRQRIGHDTIQERKGLLIGPAAKAAVVVERVLHNQAPIMAFYGGASLHQDLSDRKPSALDFAGLCSDLARP